LLAVVVEGCEAVVVEFSLVVVVVEMVAGHTVVVLV